MIPHSLTDGYVPGSRVSNGRVSQSRPAFFGMVETGSNKQASPGIKSSPSLVFVNKMLLKLSHAHPFMDRLRLFSHHDGKSEEPQRRPQSPRN